MACGALQTRSGSGALPGLVNARFRDADRSASPHLPTRCVVPSTSSSAAGVVPARHRFDDWATRRLMVTPTFVWSRGVDSFAAGDGGVVSVGCEAPGE